MIELFRTSKSEVGSYWRLLQDGDQYTLWLNDSQGPMIGNWLDIIEWALIPVASENIREMDRFILERSSPEDIAMVALENL